MRLTYYVLNNVISALDPRELVLSHLHKRTLFLGGQNLEFYYFWGVWNLVLDCFDQFTFSASGKGRLCRAEKV